MNNWLNKWPEKITEEWKKFITPNNSSAGKMYGMVKTHKNDNPVHVITSGCNTTIEKMSILVEKTLYPIVLTIGLVLKVLRTSQLSTNLLWIPLNVL